MLGKCCQILTLVLSRTSPLGLSIGSMINLKTGECTDTLMVNFRKAKKTEPQEHRNATYAPVRSVRFAGHQPPPHPSPALRLRRRRHEATKRQQAAGRHL